MAYSRTRISVVLSLLALVVVSGCSSGDDEGDTLVVDERGSPFWDAPGDVEGVHGAWGETPDESPSELFEAADAVIVGRVKDVADKTFRTIQPLEGAEQLNDYLANTPAYTTWEVIPQTWLKGTAADSITITDVGGIDPSGLYVGYIDGDLMLEPGRTYLIFLVRDPILPGDYVRLGVSRGTYDLTTGKVLVLNHPLTRDLEKFEGLSIDEFLSEAVGRD